MVERGRFPSHTLLLFRFKMDIDSFLAIGIIGLSSCAPHPITHNTSDILIGVDVLFTFVIISIKFKVNK